VRLHLTLAGVREPTRQPSRSRRCALASDARGR
jgi:hypothetical protein